MQRYILKRFGQAIICIFGISILVFSIVHLSGDPVALLLAPDATQKDYQEVKQRLGLDKPLHIQYLSFMASALQGDFGESIKFSRPCLEVFFERFPNTLRLGIVAMAWALLIGITIGIVSAVKVNTWFDNFGKIFALLGQATPVFWLAIMLILLFSVHLRWLPSYGMGGVKNIILPSFTLGYYFTAALTRLTRSSMLDVLDSEYIKMARITGVSETKIVSVHALKNAMLPVITLAALNFIMLLNGTVITETIFAWPGVGRLVVDSVFARDFPMVQTCVFIGALLFIFTNLVVDILYAYIDPRIRYH